MSAAATPAAGPTSTVGQGRAWGAITVLNATATGIGCALAIDAATTATWRWGQSWDWRGRTDDALARAVASVLHAHLRATGLPSREADPDGPAPMATASCDAPFPPARGLKTSSAAATAMLRAAADAAHVALDADTLDRLAVQAARQAGVTLTGALDDQSAVSRGGCHVTDNRAGRRLRSVSVAPWHVAVWVPEAMLPKSSVAPIDATPAGPAAAEARALLEAGDVPAALTRNGEGFLALYRQAGLPVTGAPAAAALDAGALGAGLSGTGPAVAALFDERRHLRDVSGGTWTWHRVVP